MFAVTDGEVFMWLGGGGHVYLKERPVGGICVVYQKHLDGLVRL